MLRRARLRHSFRSGLEAGCSGTGHRRKLKITARNTNSSSPEENFDSKAPANANENLKMLPGDGECHMSASDQTVRTQNRVMSMSVITRGPNARNGGIDT